MSRETLLDFFADFAELDDDFLVWDDGYRTHHRSYADVARGARAFALKLRAQGIGKGAKVVFWSENRPEWIAALWGCLLEGVIAVPIDFRSSAEFVNRIAGIVEARAILTGDSVTSSALDTAAPQWPFADFSWGAGASAPLGSPRPVETCKSRRHRPNRLHLRRYSRAEGCHHHPPQSAGVPDTCGKLGPLVSQV